MIRTRLSRQLLLTGLSLMVIVGALLSPGATAWGQFSCPPGFSWQYSFSGGSWGWSCLPNAAGGGGGGDAAAADAGPAWTASDPNAENRVDASPAEDFAVYCNPPGFVEVWRTQPDPPSIVSRFPIGWAAQTGTFGLGIYSEEVLTLNRDGGGVTLSDPNGNEKTFDLDACLSAAGLTQPPDVPCDQDALAATEEQADEYRRQIRNLQDTAQNLRNSYDDLVTRGPATKAAEEARAEAARWSAIRAQYVGRFNRISDELIELYHRRDVVIPAQIADAEARSQAALAEADAAEGRAAAAQVERVLAEAALKVAEAELGALEWASSKALEEYEVYNAEHTYQGDIEHQTLETLWGRFLELDAAVDAKRDQIQDRYDQIAGYQLTVAIELSKADQARRDAGFISDFASSLRTSALIIEGTITSKYNELQSLYNQADNAKQEADRWLEIADARQARAEENIANAKTQLLGSADSNEARAGQFRQDLDALEATITTLRNACEGAG